MVVPTHRLALLSDPHVPSIPPPQPELKLACILWGLRFRGDTKRGGVWGQETRGLEGQRDGYEAVGGDTGPLCATPPILLAPLSLAPSAFFLPPPPFLTPPPQCLGHWRHLLESATSQCTSGLGPPCALGSQPRWSISASESAPTVPCTPPPACGPAAAAVLHTSRLQPTPSHPLPRLVWRTQRWVLVFKPHWYSGESLAPPGLSFLLQKWSWTCSWSLYLKAMSPFKG